MTGGYLKQLELTKQLEQQAKKAALNRETAEIKISEAEELTASAKRLGANAAKAEKLLTEASEAFSRKDYKGALSLATQSIGVAQEAKTGKVEEVLKTTQDLLDQMGGLAKEAREPVDAIEKTRELLEKGELDRAYEAANEAWDVTERFINARMADEFERAQSLMLLAEGEEIDTESERELLTQARKSLEREDYLVSLDQLTSCLESITDSLTNMLQKRRGELVSGMDRVEGLELDLTRTRDQIERSDGYLAQGDMDNAMSSLTIADGEFRKSFSRGLLKKFDLQQERSQLLSRYLERMGGVEASIAKGKDLARDGKFWSALDLQNDLDREMSDKEMEALVKQMYWLRPKLQIARRTGNDIERAIGLLEESRKRIRGGDFPGAIDLVHQADVVLEEELKGFREVENELEKTEGLMSQADRYGLDRSRAEEGMRTARKLALRGRLGESMDQLRAAQRDLHAGIQQHLGSEIMRTELMLASAMRMGSDVAKESTVIDEIMARVRGGDYRDVDEPLEEVKLKVRGYLEVSSKQAIDRAKGLLEQYEGRANTTSSRLMLDEAIAARESNDFDKAFKMADKAVGELEKQETDMVERGLREAKRLLEINRQLGVESSTINARLSKADALRLDHKTKESLAETEEVIQLYGTVVREHIAKGVTSLSRSISAARKKGVEVSTIEEMAEKVRRSLEQGRVADAYDTVGQAEERLRVMLNQYDEVSEYMGDIEGLLDEARRNRVDASSTEELFRETKALCDTGDYEKAIELAKRTLKVAEEQTAPFMASRRLQEMKNLVATARRLGLDVSREENGANRAQAFIESGKHKEALDTVKELREGIWKRIVEALDTELGKAKEMIVRAREVGVEVSALDSIVDRAESLLSEGRINDTLRALDLVKKELDQGMIVERKASEGIDRAASVLANVRKVGLEPTGALEILKQARDHLQAARAGIAFELAKKAADMGADMAREKLMERFKELEMIQRNMAIEGPDLAPASRMKSEFRKNLEEWKFTAALASLKSMEDELGRVQRQKKLSMRTLEETKERVASGRERGLISQKVDDLLASSQASLDRGAFSASFSEAIRCRDELRSMEELYDRRMEDLKKIRERMELAAREGVDVSSPMQNFEEAERSLRELNFEEASLNLSRGDTTLRKSMGKLMEERRQEVERLYALQTEMGMDVKDAPSEVKDILQKKRLRIDDFELVGAGLTALRARLSDRMEGAVGEIAGKMQVASNSGADVSTSEFLLSQARELLGSGDLEQAWAMMKDAEGSIGVAMDERREFMDLRLQCESLIENARRNGLVMESVIELFRRSESEREGDYHRAIETMKEAIAQAEQEAASYLPELAIDIDFLGEAASGQWMRTKVTITNESKAMARDLRMELVGEIEVRGLEGVKKLRGTETLEKEFDIMPLRSGEIEVTLTLSCRPVLSDDTFGFDSSFVLDAK